jgi:uncharacterized damage-inducible protein DinB
MSSLTPDQAKLFLAAGLRSFAAEQPVTSSVILAIPPGKADHRPDDIGRSAIDLAWHIVTAENRFLTSVAAGAFDLSPVPRPDSVRTPADVVSWYSERFVKGIEGLKSMSGESLVKSVDFRGVLQLPAVAYLQIGLNHSIHHRGQLSMYLRPMGAKVPSIYGESYDARAAREAAAGPR